MNTLPLAWWQIALAGTLVFLAGTVSVGLRLRLENDLVLATVRGTIQLALVGYVLAWIFEVNTPWVVISAMAIMVTAAAKAAIDRPSRTFRGAFLGSFVTLCISGVTIALLVSNIVVRVEPWYDPRYVLPLLGMILGNTLTGISLCLDSFLERLTVRAPEVELALSLGASPWEATRDALADSVRRGMIPIVNATMVVGLVSLPGMMTGQILAGADPVDAVKYQMVVMFMLLATTSLGCVGIAFYTFKKMFDERGRLRRERVFSAA